jgi:hypothetical protein
MTTDVETRGRDAVLVQKSTTGRVGSMASRPRRLRS